MLSSHFADFLCKQWFLLSQNASYDWWTSAVVRFEVSLHSGHSVKRKIWQHWIPKIPIVSKQGTCSPPHRLVIICNRYQPQIPRIWRPKFKTLRVNSVILLVYRTHSHSRSSLCAVKGAKSALSRDPRIVRWKFLSKTTSEKIIRRNSDDVSFFFSRDVASIHNSY